MLILVLIRLWNDLLCVERDVKLYSLTHWPEMCGLQIGLLWNGIRRILWICRWIADLSWTKICRCGSWSLIH